MERMSPTGFWVFLASSVVSWAAALAIERTPIAEARRTRVCHRVLTNCSIIESPSVLERPLELGMETDSIVGQVGWFLVFGFPIGSLEGDAECLVQIP